MDNVLLQGIVVGFSIAAPVGPIGVLCIRRTLSGGHRVGFVTGLGAETADAAYGCIAGFGLTAVSSFLICHRSWIGVIGGILMCYLGASTFMSRPSELSTELKAPGLVRAYFSGLFLTLTNPTTILSFAAVFAGCGLGASPDYGAAIKLVLGVFLGSALWWLILGSGIGLLRLRVDSATMRLVNRISGAVILAFGLYALTKLP